MFKKNLGRVDRAVRLVIGAALLANGLFRLGGLRGNREGIRAAFWAVPPLMTGIIGSCPGYVPFGLSTLEQK